MDYHLNEAEADAAAPRAALGLDPDAAEEDVLAAEAARQPELDQRDLAASVEPIAPAEQPERTSVVPAVSPRPCACNDCRTARTTLESAHRLTAGPSAAIAL